MGQEEAGGGRSRSGEQYRSPALSRLDEAARSRSPARRILEQPPLISEYELLFERLAGFEARLATVEQRQLDLAVNLNDAHLAFRRLADHLATLGKQVEALVERRPGV